MPRRPLTFPWKKVEPALAELRAAIEFRTLYSRVTGPGLWLVGDEGVYLMPNTLVQKPTVIYARECDPTAVPFEEWWTYREATFGSGDGVEFIALSAFGQHLVAFRREPSAVQIHMSEESFEIGLV
jgi:hypothetical protein